MAMSIPIKCSKHIILKEKQENPKKVLVMDDNAMIRNLASQMLDICGFETFTARNGSEAVEQYKKEKKLGYPFAAVILDINVPKGMGGKDAIEKLLEIDPHVKAIVSSADYNNPAITRFRDYGFVCSLPKPYTVDELKETLDKVIKE